MSKIILLHGGPGSGKGALSQQFTGCCYFHVGAGDCLREYAKSNSDSLANRISTAQSTGAKVNVDDLAMVLEAKILSLLDKNLVLDGVVGNEAQAKWFLNFLEKYDLKCFFVHLKIDFKTVQKRLLSRYQIPGNSKPYSSYEDALKDCPEGILPIQRSDDLDVAIIKNRFEIYLNNFSSIYEVLNLSDRIQIFEVNADQPTDEIFQEVSQNLFINK